MFYGLKKLKKKNCLRWNWRKKSNIYIDKNNLFESNIKTFNRHFRPILTGQYHTKHSELQKNIVCRKHLNNKINFNIHYFSKHTSRASLFCYKSHLLVFWKIYKSDKSDCCHKAFAWNRISNINQIYSLYSHLFSGQIFNLKCLPNQIYWIQ